MAIITYLLTIIQEQQQLINWLLSFLCKYIPLKQWAFDDSHSPKYQKFKTDKLPVIIKFQKQDWDFLLQYYKWRYKKNVKPVQRRNSKNISEDVVCPVCDAPHHYIYDNNGGNGQYLCKICGSSFVTGESLTKPLKLKCPYCSNALVPRKNRKHFIVHKCVNSKCYYYLQNLKKVSKEDLKNNNKYKYKLR